MIAHFFAGDIENGSVVEYWSEVPVAKDQVLSMYQQLAIPCLLPSVCPVFPRSRWVGGELSISWAGLLASLHGLLKPLLSKWAGPTGGASRQPQPVATLHTFQVGWQAVTSQVSRAEDVEPHGHGQAPPTEDPEGFLGFLGNPEYDPMLDAADSEKNLLDRATGTIDWHQLNVSMKMRCARWANRDDVETTLVAMRSTMSPCLALMHRLLQQAGQQWDRKQQCRAAAGQARDYRILCAPKLTMDIFQQLSRKFHELVEALPLKGKTRQSRVLLFRLLSVAGGALEMLLGKDRGHPYRCFALVLSGQAEAVFDDPPCLLDELSSKLLRRFDSPKALASVEAESVFLALAEMISLDISTIEARHAAARRVNTIRSSQAKTMSFESLASVMVTRSLVKARNDWMKARGFSSKQTQRVRRNARQPKKHRRGGGAWRTFMHKQKIAFGQSKAASADYHRLRRNSPDEFAELQRIGRLATVASRSGHLPYGARKRTHRQRGQLAPAILPDDLVQQIKGIKRKHAEATLEKQAQCDAELQCLARQASRACSVWQQQPTVQNPGPVLVKSMSTSILPVQGSLPVMDCCPPVAEVTKERGGNRGRDSSIRI